MGKTQVCTRNSCYFISPQVYDLHNFKKIISKIVDKLKNPYLKCGITINKKTANNLNVFYLIKHERIFNKTWRGMLNILFPVIMKIGSSLEVSPSHKFGGEAY